MKTFQVYLLKKHEIFYDMTKIILENQDGDSSDENKHEENEINSVSNNASSLEKSNENEKPNIFSSSTNQVADMSSFPKWDIEPENRLINPRIKKSEK